MCVAQYRDFVYASTFQCIYPSEGNYEKDLKDKNIKVGVTINYEEGNYSVFYKTDLREMKKIAKLGNPYAIKFLENNK